MIFYKNEILLRNLLGVSQGSPVPNLFREAIRCNLFLSPMLRQAQQDNKKRMPLQSLTQDAVYNQKSNSILIYRFNTNLINETDQGNNHLSEHNSL